MKQAYYSLLRGIIQDGVSSTLTYKVLKRAK